MNLRVFLLAALFSAIGLSIFAYKALIVGIPVLPNIKVYSWKVEARIAFNAVMRNPKISLYIPSPGDGFEINNENFVSEGYGFGTVQHEGNRQAIWSSLKARGDSTLYYQAILRPTARLERKVKTPPTPAELTLKPAQQTAAKPTIDAIKDAASSFNDRALAILRLVHSDSLPPELQSLTKHLRSEKSRIELAVQLFSMAGIPARSVHGIKIFRSDRKAPLVHWIEVFDGEHWKAFDAAHLQAGVPEEYFAWWRGSESLYQVKGVENPKVLISVSRHELSATALTISEARDTHPILSRFSLYRLPVQTQAAYRLALLIPVGALIVALVRNILGIRTFGTFMPVLVALAFRETQLLWGLILFTVVVSFGLLCRAMFARLKLLLIPRLAATLTVVILIIVTISMVTHALHMERGLSVALFPLVILTMTIERMSIVWEEVGGREAIQRGILSLMVASLAYMVITNRYLEYLLFAFPELLLVNLSLAMLLGRYTGYRVTEYYRFRNIEPPRETI